MNKNVLIVLIGGFVVAILVAVLVQASLGGKKAEDGPKTQVLVAAKDLAIGTELSPADLKWQSWPGAVFTGAITRKKEDQKPEEALEGRLVQRVSAGQPVLATYVFKEGRGNIVAATLGKGMRAVAIPVKAETMAGGFISPGDFVDVILTYNIEINTRNNSDVQSLVTKTASETVLQNVKVLAVDQESSREEDKAKIARTVTLEVTTEGSQKLALASTMGDITLSLRGIGDESVTEENMTTTDIQVGRIQRDVTRLQGGGAGGNVRIYNGTNVQDLRPRGSLYDPYQANQPEQAETTEGTEQ